MDAIKYLKEMNRMCNGSNCCECPLFENNNGKKVNCKILEKEYAEKAVEIVEKWSAEHPIKTRQSEFLKMFPNATLDAIGSLDICPIAVDKNMNCQEETGAKCLACRKNYWLAEMK